MDAYQYSKLTPGVGAIRLIVLQPSDDLKAEIHCSLFTTTLRDCEEDIAEHYVALSYAWGNQVERSSIIIDGKPMSITASLDCALRHVREDHRILRVWADGICINQEDTDEKNQQVRQMDLVYSTANHTVIFLGAFSPDCDTALACIISQNTGPKKDLEPDPAMPFYNVIGEHILARPWFTRVWVFQELVLSKDPWIQIGQARVRWDPFCEYVLKQQNPAAPNSRGHKLLVGMNQSRKTFQNSRNEGFKVKGGQLFADILSTRRALGATDPRDLIYGHLGLVDSVTRSVFPIDYEKTLAQVFEDFAKFYVSSCRNISILLYVEGVDRKIRRPGLPSWVPDWTSPHSHDSLHPIREFGEPDFTNLFKGPVPSCTVPHVLGIVGETVGTVQSLVPISFWPDFKSTDVGTGRASPHESSFVDWLQSQGSMKSLNPREVFQLLLKFHADLLGQFEMQFSDYMRVTTLEDELPELHLETISFLTKLEPSYGSFSCRGGPVEGTHGIKFLLSLVFENFIALVNGCRNGQSVALFEEGHLGLVPQSIHIGDVIVRPWYPFQQDKYHKSFLNVRPKINVNNMELDTVLRKHFEDLEPVYDAMGDKVRIHDVQHCEYVGAADIWKGFRDIKIGYGDFENLKKEYRGPSLDYDLPITSRLQGQLTIFAIH
jgi:hypothetical protein